MGFYRDRAGKASVIGSLLLLRFLISIGRTSGNALTTILYPLGFNFQLHNGHGFQLYSSRKLNFTVDQIVLAFSYCLLLEVLMAIMMNIFVESLCYIKIGKTSTVGSVVCIPEKWKRQIQKAKAGGVAAAEFTYTSAYSHTYTHIARITLPSSLHYEDKGLQQGMKKA